MRFTLIKLSHDTFSPAVVAENFPALSLVLVPRPVLGRHCRVGLVAGLANNRAQLELLVPHLAGALQSVEWL